jgi:hypothetical protein
MESAPARSATLGQGLATLVVLAVAVFLFGIEHVGHFCLFLTPVLIAVTALRNGMFPWGLGRHQLVRSSDPRGFMIALAACALLAGLQLWVFVAGLRHAI